jgi:hypothetical protein
MEEGGRSLCVYQCPCAHAAIGRPFSTCEKGKKQPRLRLISLEKTPKRLIGRLSAFAIFAMLKSIGIVHRLIPISKSIARYQKNKILSFFDDVFMVHRIDCLKPGHNLILGHCPFGSYPKGREEANPIRC